MITRLCAALGLLLVAGLATSAVAASTVAVSAASTVKVRCDTSMVDLPVTWYFPQSIAPAGLIWLQHGFFRTDENVSDLASKLARSGFLTVAITIPSIESGCNFNNSTAFLPNFALLFGHLNREGSPLLTSARTAAAAVGLTVHRLPQRFVFSGHSAGGAAVTLVAREYVTRFPAIAGRLKGLLLLDPVENFARSMETALPSLGGVPILAISAPASPCNANTSGTGLLLRLGRPFVGFEVANGSHCDAEGASGNPVLCGLICGRVRFGGVFLLQLFAIGWAGDLLLDRTSGELYPGGSFYDALASGGQIRTH